MNKIEERSMMQTHIFEGNLWRAFLFVVLGEKRVVPLLG